MSTAILVAGGVLAAAVLYGGFALLSSTLHLRTPAAAIAVAWFLYSVGWVRRRTDRVPFGLSGQQADRSIAMRGPSGLFYFGALLGAGVFTHMSTPLVVAGFWYAGGSAPVLGLAYGMGFGLGRVAPAFAANVLRGPVNVQAVAIFFTTQFIERVRVLNALAATMGFTLATVALWESIRLLS